MDSNCNSSKTEAWKLFWILQYIKWTNGKPFDSMGRPLDMYERGKKVISMTEFCILIDN